ncbi:MAG: serine/threonine protein kinase [Planctomycetes bacterium]|nr:serine/threonine protein kinase [Planctomycetota bacterium]
MIGRGSTGVVYLGRERLRKDNFKAVKILDKHTLENDSHQRQELADAKRRELQGIQEYLMVGRGHPGIVQIDDAAETDDHLYYAMELADDANRNNSGDSSVSDPNGRGSFDIENYAPLTLEVVMSRQPVMDPGTALEITKSILNTLGHIHDQGLLHRDVKPSNIVFVNGRPKLCDFGLLTRMDRNVTQVGTPGYLPPDAILDQTADLYAVGIILYEMLSGLHRGQIPKMDMRKSLRGLPRVQFRAANQVMLIATRPEKKSRFQTAQAMLGAIDARVEPHLRLRRRIKWAAASLLLAMVVWLGVNYVPWTSIAGQAIAPRPVIPVRLTTARIDSVIVLFSLYYDNGDSRKFQFDQDLEGVVLSDFYDGRPAIVFGTKLGTADYGKLVVMNHAAPTSTSELIRTHEERPTSVPPSVWDFQPHPRDFLVHPLLTGDLDPSPGNELLVALNHDDAPAELVMLGRGGKRLGSYWHFGWYTAAWLCDVDNDGTNEILCQIIANRREATMGNGRKMESQYNGMIILTADMLRASSGYWGMNNWLSAGSPVTPLAYGYCTFLSSGDDEKAHYWQLSREQRPCIAGSAASPIRAYFLEGQFIDLDNKLRPIRIEIMPSAPFDRARLPRKEDVWVQTWPPPDSMKDSPANRE